MRITTRRLAPLALALSALAFPAGASATSTTKQIKAAKAAGVTYLESLQQANGSLAGFDGDWALGALAAAGVAAGNVKSAEASTDARTYYRNLFGNPATWPGEPSPSVTEFERATLNSYAAGIDPARVSVTQNLIAQIVSRYQPSAPGYYGGTTDFGGALFGLLALGETKTNGGKTRVPAGLLAKSIAVLRANQHTDGGWNFERVEGNPTKLASESEPDETGAAMAALCSAGVPSTDSAITKATHYLEGDLVSSSGAFEAPFGANTDSNAWGVQGLNACGINPQGSAFTTPAGKTPIDFLLAQQVAGGSFVFEAGETEGSEYESQDAVRAISGAGFTAKPPAAHDQPKFLASTHFESGKSSLLTLVVEDGSSAPKACAVSVSPAGSTTTLLAVLEAAKASSTPAGCITGFQPTSGKAVLTQIDGSPASPEPKWNVSIDGGKSKAAKLSTKISLGDTISLQLG
jgi:hypothetical protein